jgi:hypothetical protein
MQDECDGRRQAAFLFATAGSALSHGYINENPPSTMID